MFLKLLRPVFSTMTSLLARSTDAPRSMEHHDKTTPVADYRPAEMRKDSTVVESTAKKNVSPPTTNRRFRRNTEEIALGLTAEEAATRRADSATAPKRPVGRPRTTPAVKSEQGEKKAAKRIRRTAEEIRLGLSIEEAAARRGVAVPTTQRTARVEQLQQLPAAPHGTSDLITTLSPRIQARATAVTRFRRSGFKGTITEEMLSAADKHIATKGVTKCPPGIDSDGYDHFAQKETR